MKEKVVLDKEIVDRIYELLWEIEYMLMYNQKPEIDSYKKISV